jgi:hypothetical protein
MRNFSSFRIIRVTLAFAVALWMAGAGCLIGCENVTSASAASEQTANTSVLVVSGEVCAKHGANSQHGAKSAGSKSTKTAKATKPASGNASLLAFHAGSSSMMDCPLAVNATAALAKARTDNADADFALANVSPLLASSLEESAAHTPPARLLNRGHTYLRCCVFLI